MKRRFSLAQLISPLGGPSPEVLRQHVAGKVVLVTGASFGIGEQTAKKLGRSGATVLLLARSEARLHALATEIKARGGAAHVYATDLCDLSSVKATAMQIGEEHGRVDVIVNNAGMSLRRSLHLSYDRVRDFERTMAVNYLGPVQLMLGLLPAMRAHAEGGHIVNVSTIGVRVPPSPRWGAYQAAKTAMDIWLRSIASEVAADSISMSTIYMALVNTRMSAPTPVFKAVPGLDADEAADLVCRAITERPRTIRPWWLPPAEVIGTVLREPIERALSWVYRATDDSAKARGSSDEAVPELVFGALRGLVRSGVVGPVPISRWPRLLEEVRHPFGLSTLCSLAAGRDPEGVALIDERGSLTFGELEKRTERLARALQSKFRIGHRGALAVMCRNHRGAVEALLAASRLGADLLLLNVDMAGEQLDRVLSQYTVGALIVDEDLKAAVGSVTAPRITAWHRDDAADDSERVTVDDLIAEGGPRYEKRAHASKIVILTSGTTGTPKGAPRRPKASAIAAPIATVLSKLPLRAGRPTLVGPPMFHGFGLAFTALAMAVRAPLVLFRKFDAKVYLRAIEDHQVGVVVGVPVMLRRLLDQFQLAERRPDISSLKAVISGGAPLRPQLSQDFMATFGDVLYNLYGSTEVGFGAIAQPSDLRAAPGTVGRAPLGTTLRILDQARNDVEPGQVGALFVNGPLAYGGYTGGAKRETVDNMINSGDLGTIDTAGRLFIVGRQDDMIVSGGENIFPREVEDALVAHQDVKDAVVVGVQDTEFGQRLRAYVVCHSASSANETALGEFLRGKLERYKVPREMVFLHELPRNALGKVAIKRLKEAQGLQLPKEHRAIRCAGGVAGFERQSSN